MDGSFLVKALLDTCTFLWLVRGDSSLSSPARAVIADPSNEIFLSAVSAWEIGVKFGLGKLELPVEPSIFVPRERSRHRLVSLPVDETASLAASSLPLQHKDPFDRLLVGQALSLGLTLLTPDPLIAQYAVPVLWN